MVGRPWLFATAQSGPAGRLCSSELRPARSGSTLSAMSLPHIKMSVAGSWVLAAIVIGLIMGASSVAGLIALATFGLLPPLAMLVLWNDPAQTMSESIREGRG